MSEVLRLADVPREPIRQLLAEVGLELVLTPAGPVPGSFWGASEAGLRGSRLFARPDTPVHSVLHEAAHYACMSDERRRALDTDAGGDELEECAVCVLQVCWAARLPQVGADRMLADMDRWGYSFRLGSARRWWATDAEDGRRWLERYAGRSGRCVVGPAAL